MDKRTSGETINRIGQYAWENGDSIRMVAFDSQTYKTALQKQRANLDRRKTAYPDGFGEMTPAEKVDAITKDDPDLATALFLIAVQEEWQALGKVGSYIIALVPEPCADRLVDDLGSWGVDFPDTSDFYGFDLTEMNADINRITPGRAIAALKATTLMTMLEPDDPAFALGFFRDAVQAD